MAQGDVTVFDEAILAIHNAVHDFDTDSFLVFYTSATPTAGTTSPTKADFTEVSGGNFPVGGTASTLTAVNSAGTTTLDCTTNLSHAKDPTNPADIKYAVLYNASKADQCVLFVEIDAAGADGTLGLISLTWGANIWTSQQA